MTTEVRLLVEQIRAGNNRAFRTFIERYQKLVAHIVFRMVPNTADREDLCQDVFLKVYQNLDRFRFDAKMSTWIGRIAYNTCVNYLRKGKVPLFDDRSPETASIENISGDGMFPDRLAGEKDMASRLQAEMERLDAPYRTILTLYHIDGMTYAEIGKIMGLPDGTVKSYLFRARKRLKERLMAKYEREEL